MKLNRVIILLPLVLIPLLFGIPLLSVGLQDIHALRYLDEGAYSIIKVWKEVYTHGPFYWGSFDSNYIYPKAFYNLAGIFLYPYSYLQGAHFQMDVLVLRGLNIFFGIASLITLFSLVKRVSDSVGAAFLAAFLFAITPEFLTWTVNVRPNPMEIFSTFLALYFCVRLCEQWRYRFFLLGTLAGALAFASKYGGLPLLFLLPLFSVYLIWRQGKEGVPHHPLLLFQSLLYQIAFPILLGMTGLALIFFSWAFVKNNFDVTQIFLSLTQHEFSSFFLPKVVKRLAQWKTIVNGFTWGLLFFLFLFEVLLIVFWSWARVWKKQKLVSLHWKQGLFLIGFFSLQTIFIYSVVLFATSLAYLTNPTHFLSELGFTTYFMTLGGSFGDQKVPGFLEYLRLVSESIPGFWFFLSVVFFTFFQLLKLKGSYPKKTQHQLLFLGVYMLFSVYVFVKMADPQLRHVLPGLGILYGLIGVAIYSVLTKWKTTLFTRAQCILLLLILLGFSGSQIAMGFNLWKMKKESHEDIGLQVGNWIQENYGSQTRILTDYWAAYTPPDFKNIETITYTEWKTKIPLEQKDLVANLMDTFNPDLILVTWDEHQPRAVSLDNLLQERAQFRNRYGRVKSFVGQRLGDRLQRIDVFQKIIDSPIVGWKRDS